MTYDQPEWLPRAAAPYPVEPGERRPADPRRPWLEAGRSHDAQANRLLTYHRTHGRLQDRIFLPADVHRLRDRGRACRKHARTLDRLTAHGWVVLHDRAVLGTREVLDHVLVGPGGVAVLFTIPAQDRDPAGQPGPRTGLELDATIGRWVMHTQPRLIDLLTARLSPDWVVHINGRVVVTRTRRPYQHLDAALVPTQVIPWLTTFGAPFGPLHVHALAALIEEITPPAHLTG